MNKRRLSLALFLVLATLSAVAMATVVSAITLAPEVSVESIGSLDEFHRPAYGIALQGDPKGGGWG